LFFCDPSLSFQIQVYNSAFFYATDASLEAFLFLIRRANGRFYFIPHMSSVSMGGIEGLFAHKWKNNKAIKTLLPWFPGSIEEQTRNRR